jgi:methionyl-tRNA synthetase
VEERAPWVLAKDEAQAGALDETLASLCEGLRTVTVLLHPYMPLATAKLLAALGREELGYDAAALATSGGGGRISALDPLFPKQQ